MYTIPYFLFKESVFAIVCKQATKGAADGGDQAMDVDMEEEDGGAEEEGNAEEEEEEAHEE